MLVKRRVLYLAVIGAALVAGVAGALHAQQMRPGMPTRPPRVAPTSLPTGEVGFSYSQSITGSGGSGAITLALSNVSNSTGLVLSGDGTGTISITGTPTVDTDTGVLYAAAMVNPTQYELYAVDIGSGAVESACKTVVAQRLKLAGMRWRERGTDAVCHLRALYRSERNQWQHFWRRNYQRVNTCSTN